jgi:hypothetical protein
VRIAAKVVSWCLHPAVITALLFLVIGFSNNDPLADVIVPIVTYSVIPIAALLMARGLEVVRSADQPSIRERAPLLLTAELSYVAGLLLTLALGLPMLIAFIEAAYLANSLIIILITLLLRFKISLHVSTASAIATALTYLYGARLAAFFLIPLTLSWARLELKAHTTAQVLAAWAFAPITLAQLLLYHATLGLRP